MFCENCGANIPPNTSFCSSCGTSFAAAPVPAPPPQPQPAYTPPPPQPYYNQQTAYRPAAASREPLSVGSFIGMFFLSALPIAGFIMLLIWAFSSDVNVNKKNYSRAILIMSLIGIGVWLIFFLISLAIVSTMRY